MIDQGPTKFSSEGFTIPKLPITIDLEKLINKIIYYNDSKDTIKERINDTQYRVSYDKDRHQGIMDYDEIIRQLTHINEDEGNNRWEIEEILYHKWNPRKKVRLLVLIKWKELEEPSWEPMEIIKEDDPVTLAEHA